MRAMGNEQDIVGAWSRFKVQLGPRPLTYSDHLLEQDAHEARNELVVHYSPIVYGVAPKVHQTLQGHVEIDDLISFGMFGLMDALERFDTERMRADGNGMISFKTYATPRIRGQMFDEVRKLSWIPRNVLAKGRDMEKAREEAELILGRPAEHAELATHMGLDLIEYWRLFDQSNISIVPLVSEISTNEFESFESTFNTAEIDHASNPEDLVGVSHIATMISDSVANMDERQRLILALYYLQDLTLGEIGEVLGVTGGRVCQLLSRALTDLQGGLSGVLAA